MKTFNFRQGKSLLAGLGIALSYLILLNGCYNDKAEKLYPSSNGNACDTAAMKYSVHIQPILTANCAVSGCHTTADKASAGGYAYDSYLETKVSVINGKLLKSIKHLSGASQMPKGSAQLESCKINKISAWVNQGALEN